MISVDVEAITYLRRESSVIEDEWNLPVLDIVVRLKDGSIVNVEMQKIGYRFPGERSCCYSSDLVLRQYIHRFRQISDTGLELPLLQHYVFVPLDIFRSKLERETGQRLTKQDAWLLFLSSDRPEDILRITEEHPEFKEIYEQIFAICRDVERMMDMYSEELAMMDRNTVKYMIDELQEKANAEAARANAEAARADAADRSAAEAVTENRKLKEQAALKNMEEIREMYKAGISPEQIGVIKKMNIHEVEKTVCTFPGSAD